MSAQAGEMSSRNPPDIHRQGSVLSRVSDYDVLDVIHDDPDDDGTSKATDGNNFLVKNREISVKLSVRESHGLVSIGRDVFSTTRLYDLECLHSGRTWKIVRKYTQFEELHRTLRFYRAALILSRAKDSKASKVPQPPPDNGAHAVPRRKMGMSKAKALKFPNKPEMFVSSASCVEKRRRQLEIYINAVIQDSKYRTHEATLRFLEISSLSFKKRSGEKFHEGFIHKRAGGRRLLNPLGCMPLSPAASTWNKRWLVLKDSYLCYLRSNQEVADVMLFDRDFDEVKAGFRNTRIRHGLIITNTVRELSLKTTTFHKTRNWVNSITRVAEASEYVHETKHHSFAPTRKELAHWYVDACGYFADIASALENATEEIFITDWWLTPELFLRRPVLHMTDDSRLDRILHRKAEQGVKVYILLYKEIEMAVGGIQSLKAKNNLENLHPNILVMRHPDHIKSTVYMWTHHEKIVCVDQRVAFLGGLDLCFGRWDDACHRLTDLGSVQQVTPPVSRPVSVNVPADSWKGLGLEDLQKTLKKEEKILKGSKRRLASQSDTQLKDRLTSPLARRLLDRRVKQVKGKRRRHYTENQQLLREVESDSDIMSHMHVRKPRSFSLAGGEIADEAALESLNLEMGSLAIPQIKLLTSRRVSRSMEPLGDDAFVFSLNSDPMNSDSDADQDVFCDSSETSGLITKTTRNDTGQAPPPNTAQAPPPNIKSLQRQNSIDEVDRCHNTNELVNGIDGLDVSATVPLRKNGTVTGADEGAPQSTDQSYSQPTHQINIKVEKVLTLSQDSEVKKSHVPFECNTTLMSLTSQDSTGTNLSQTDLLPFSQQTSDTGTRAPDDTDCAVSLGFTELEDVNSNQNNLTVKSLPDFDQKQSKSDKTRKQPVQLQLEPIRGFSVDESVTLRKKSQGKTPNPPAPSVILRSKSPQRRNDSVEKQHSLQAVKEEIIVPHKQKKSMSSTTAAAKKSWKKIRNSMDKVKIVSRHETGGRNSLCDGLVDSRRSSSTGSNTPQDSSSKYWMGKDYVNWIFKDLDTAEAPFADGIDRFVTVRMPWHDIACVVFNKAATDVARHFIQRWNHAKKVKVSSKTSSKYPLLLPRSTQDGYKRLPPFIKDQCQLVNVQILRSCPGWACGADKGERSIYNAYMNLIGSSEHYVYIENQFFISWCGTEVENCICEALVNRILRAHHADEKFRVYIVLPLLPAFEADLDPQVGGGSPLFSVLHWVQMSLSGHENSLFKKLYKHGLDPHSYVTVCGLRKHGLLNQLPVTELIYVHSKLMIVDDKKCIIGSANINDRSLSGERDSEIAALIEDELFIDSKMSGSDYQAGRFCFTLRNTLFREHLGLRESEIIQDITCDEFYKKTWMTTAAINTSIFDKVFNCLPTDTVTTFDALRAYRSTTPQAVTDPVTSRTQLAKVKGHLVLYPLNFLRDETLRNHAGVKENMIPDKFWT